MLRENIKTHFPELSENQLQQLEALKPLYEEWNAKINLISRKDIESFNERHLLHSLALTFLWQPTPGEQVVDIGTGGGFPGIPLAIAYPNVDFLLVDSIGKKIKVVKEVASELKLDNVKAIQERAENVTGEFETAVSRAVARLKLLTSYCTKSKMKVGKLVCLKGGDLKAEINEVANYRKEILNLSEKFAEPFFETKQVISIYFRSLEK